MTGYVLHAFVIFSASNVYTAKMVICIDLKSGDPDSVELQLKKNPSARENHLLPHYKFTLCRATD